jgi:hypothetical protein
MAEKRNSKNKVQFSKIRRFFTNKDTPKIAEDNKNNK